MSTMDRKLTNHAKESCITCWGAKYDRQIQCNSGQKVGPKNFLLIFPPRGYLVDKSLKTKKRRGGGKNSKNKNGFLMITCWIHSWTNMQTQQTRLCYFLPFAALIFGQYNGCLLFILGLCKKHNKDLEIRPKKRHAQWNVETTSTFPSKRYQRALIVCVSWAIEENAIHAYSVCSCPLVCEQRRRRRQQGRLNIPFIPFTKSR